MEQAVRPKLKKAKSKPKDKPQNELSEPMPVIPPDLHVNVKDVTKTDDHLVEEDSVAKISDAVDQIDLNSKPTAFSPVVPGHFYKLCSAKQAQDSFLSSKINEETRQEQDATSDLAADNSLKTTEASAPLEEPSLEDAVSPSAPIFAENHDTTGELIFEESLQDIMRMNEEISIEDEVDDVLLPVHEDDWELGVGDQQVDNIYPTLENPENAQDGSPNMEPFTQEQLSAFYHNVLLEHADTYIDQFLMDSNNYDDKFKTLLSAYYQARQRLLKVKQNYDNQQKNVKRGSEDVFILTLGKVEAEAFCQDQRKVSHTHRFEVCKYDPEASAQLSLILREDRRIASEDATLACYSSTVARLHCEQRMFEVTERHRHHRNKLKEYTKQKSPSATQSSILLQLIDESVTELKCICNVLFSFIRRRRTQDEAEDRFWKDVEKWIALIILNLLQSSDSSSSTGRHFSEEMFVMNHILRCPPGMHQWADGLVQVSGPNLSDGGKKDQTSLDHSICLLYLALRPPKGREGFLAEFMSAQSGLSRMDSSGSSWTMIDDDGDEVDSPPSPTQSLLPLENDLTTIFRQIPLEALLAHVLHLSKFSDGYRYSNPNISSEDVMLTIAACDLVCDILGEGLATFGRPKYKQLVRRVAQAIRNIVLVVSQQWQHYKMIRETEPTSQRYNTQRLQLEFDELCKRCVSRLLSVAKLGIYQFIADLSYHNVSPRAAETIYLLMNVPPGVRSEVDALISAGYSQQEWLDFIQDPDTKLAFEEHLSTMPANEIVYLLTTFANLAQARPPTERHLINIIAIDIFKVSFVYKSTRDVCSKTGRELLCSVASHHPYVISTLVQFVEDNLSAVSSVAVYALSDLPFSSWQPTDNDLSVFRTWLMTNQVNSTECKLAQIIIQGLSYDYKELQGTLLLSHSSHQQLAVALVEACVRVQQQQAGFVMKSFDQVNKVASAVKLTSHPLHQQFVSWCWKIMLKLKLHQNQQLSPTIQASKHDSEVVARSFAVPDINTDSAFLPILHAAKEKHPMACYVAIMASNIGHKMDTFLHDGLEYLHNLAANGNFIAALSCLDCCVPMFFETTVNLAQNHRFTDMLNSLLHSSDEGFVAGFTSYLLSDTSTQVDAVTLLASVIANHVKRASDDNGSMKVLSYWLQMVLVTSGWFKDRHLRTLVDNIFKAAFLIGKMCLLECRTMLYDNYVDMVLHSLHGNNNIQHKNMVSSFFHMVAGGNHHEPASFVPTIASNENVYFKYEALLVETRYEDDCELWPAVLSYLRADPKMSIESAVKRSSAKLKLSHSPIYSHLCLYRWAELALHTPHDHPLLPVIWYNFFLRFIFLPLDGGNSFGCRFFDPVAMLPLYNKLRLRLQASMEHHYGVISSKGADANAFHNHETLVKLYQAFKLWIEEPKIHECNLYLQSLPSQYNPGMLACVRTRNLTACNEAVGRARVKKEVAALRGKWSKLQNPEKPNRRNYIRNSYHRHKSTNETEERITHLLKQFETPLPIPDHIMYGTWSPPVSVSDVASLCNYDAVIRAIDQDLRSMSSFADQFVRTEAKQQQINSDYLKILPHLYYLKATELAVEVKCQSSFSPTHKCTGPAKINLRFKQKTLNESVSEKLDANRSVYKREIEELMDDKLSEEICYASLHIESVIRALEINAKRPTHGDNLKRCVVDAGIQLFYLLADMYSGERSTCLPTKQLIASAVELLGQTFISQSHDQARHILDQVLSNPASASLLSPHFAPGWNSGMSLNDSVKEYIKMYQRVVKIVSTTKKDDPDVLFVLLTKFEMPSWLESVQPSLSDRVQLLQYVVIGIVGCVTKSSYSDYCAKNKESSESKTSSEVILHKPSHSAVHAVYINHFKALLSHHFPDMFVDCLHYLLEASRTHDVTVEPWEVLLTVSFSDQLTLQSEDQSVASVYSYCSRMDWSTLQNAIDVLTGYFNNFRESSVEVLTKGLYSYWEPYIPSIGHLFSCLCSTMLTFVRREQVPLLFTETKLTADPHWSILEPVLSLYGSFLQPAFNPDSQNLCWPWLEDDEKLSKHITDSLIGVLKQFFQSNEKPILSGYLSYVWSIYAKTFLQEKHKVPSYMYKAYHAMLKDLPWHLFLPDLAAMDQMIQFCDGQNEHPIHFMCFLVPKIPWATILDMFHVSVQLHVVDNAESKPLPEQWNPVTSEVLCRLLHLLFSLGGKAQRLEVNEDLKQLFNDVEALPWYCISVDQVDYLANMLSDRFSWASVILFQSSKNQKADPRHCAVRLLKVVCRLPLVGEERGTIKSQSSVHLLALSTLQYLPEDWLKQQSYIRSVGRLLQKVKTDDKAIVSLVTKPLIRFVERTLESIEICSSYDDSSNNLPLLLSALFDYLNSFPAALQEPVLNSLRAVIERRSVCKSCSMLQEGSTFPQQCQNCTFLRSRALSPVTLLSSLTAVCQTVTYAGYACALIEDTVDSYMDSKNAPSQEMTDRLEIAESSWKDLTNAYHKPVTNNEEFVKQCLASGCILALYVHSLDSVCLPGFHNNFLYLTGDLPSDEATEKLYKRAVLDVQWLSSLTSTQDNESKYFVLWDHFLNICAVLMKSATFSPKQGFTVYTVSDLIAQLLPQLEQISIDRVKTGLLGSIGISKQSPLSSEFRLAARSLSVFLKHWIARINPELPDAIDSAQKAFEALKHLPTLNKNYQQYQVVVGEACQMLSEESPDLAQARKFLSLFIRKHFIGKKYLSHISEVL